MNFGINVVKTRKKIKISQKQLAEAAGVSQSMICQVEKNVKIPNVIVGYAIAKALHTTVDELCKGA